MDLVDVLKVGARRWYALLPLLVVAALVTVNAYRSVEVVYTASATVGVAAPSSITAQPQVEGQPAVSRTNGLLANGGPVLLANLLALALSEPSFAQEVAATAPDAAFTADVVTRASNIQIPLVVITSAASTPEAVTETLAVVVDGTNAQLGALQTTAGVPADLQATTYSLGEQTRPAADFPGRLRATAATGVAGLGIAVILVLAVDRVLRAFAGGGGRRRADGPRP